MGAIVEEDQEFQHMPDYSIEFADDDMVLFRSRGTVPQALSHVRTEVAPLSSDAYHDARTVAPGWDVYYLEQEWRDWITEPPRDPDAAFVGFCRKWFEKRGSPK